MSLVQKIDGVTITNRVLLNGGSHGGVVGWPSSAWYGEPMTAGLQLDDPLGNLIVVPWTTYTADETSDTTHPRIFTGWITAVRVSRGPYRDGPGRVWDIDIIDQNAIFSFEVFRSSAASVRPAETDVARAQAAIASHAMGATPIFDNGRLNTAGPLNQGAANYVAQYPAELFASITHSDKNYYAYWDDDAEQISLHFDVATNNPASSIAISNDIADEDATTFYPFIDAELTIDPSRQFSGVLLGYTNGRWVYARDDDLFGPSEFSPVNFLRDDVYQTDRISVQTTALAQVDHQLEERAEPNETAIVTIRVPAASVNEAHAGMAISLKATHLPGYESGTMMAIIRRNVVPAPGRRDFYDVTLELSNDTDTTRGPGSGVAPDGPYEPTCDEDAIAFVQSEYEHLTGSGVFGGDGYIDLDATPTEGNLCIVVTTWFENVGNQNITNVIGYTAITPVLLEFDRGMQCQVWYRIADGSEDNHVTFDADTGGFGDRAAAAFLEYAGVDTLDAWDTIETSDPPGFSASPIDLPLGTVTPTEGRTALIFGFMIPSLDQNDGWVTDNLVAPMVEDVRYDTINTSTIFILGGHQIESTTSGSYTPELNSSVPPANNMAGYMSAVVTFLCSGGLPPAYGSEITLEHVADGDDTTTTFNTRYAYIPGSLKVYVDGVQIIAGLTESDPTTGEFTLDFAPHAAIGDTAAERVTASYQFAGTT